ncbi:MAG: hypothetical protein ABI573_05290 [Chloroflexota bacterium]
MTLDTAKRVEELIPVEGGVISATGTDGTVYRLEIPSDALLAATKVGLTPLRAISGMPFGDQPHAVQMSPEGLFFQNFATLTITPPNEIPIDQQVVFGYQKDGQDLILATPVIASSEIKIRVQHFSGTGVTTASLAQGEAARAALGGNLGRALESRLNEAIANERQRVLLGGAEDNSAFVAAVREILAQYDEQVVKVRVAAMGQSCDAAKLALETAIAFERQRELMGFGDQDNTVFDRYPGLFDKATRSCVLEEFAACVEHHRIFLMLPLYDSILRQNAIVPYLSPGILEEARDLTVKCLTFKLELESTAKLNLEASRSTSSVTSEVILRYRPETELISGIGTYDNTAYDTTFGTCNVTATPGGGTLAVIGLLYEVEAGNPDADGNYPDAAVSDLSLHYMPTTSSERSSITCPGTGPLPFALPVWSLTYLDAHATDLDGTGLTATDWDVSSGELFATKDWDLIGVHDPHGTEKGRFKLYHAPGA